MIINTDPRVIERVHFTKREVATLNEAQTILQLCSSVPSDQQEEAIVAADSLEQFMDAKFPPTEIGGEEAAGIEEDVADTELESRPPLLR